jgi:hypothetical protein
MSFRSPLATGLLAIAALAFASSRCRAAAGTDQIAYKGQPIQDRAGWQRGVVELLNDPRRGDGWSDWFSEWPSDVGHYEFHATNTEQLNEVIATFCRIEVASPAANQAPPPPLEIHLCPLAEPSGYGWVSRFEKGNRIPAVFSLGNQQELDNWFARTVLPKDGKFGVMRFDNVPVAVPPTLTIFVGNDSIDLTKIRIPERIHVSPGYLPRLWHASNLAEPKPRQPDKDAAAAEEAKLSEKERITFEEIHRYLKTRTAQPRE